VPRKQPAESPPPEPQAAEPQAAEPKAGPPQPAAPEPPKQEPPDSAAGRFAGEGASVNAPGRGRILITASVALVLTVLR